MARRVHAYVHRLFKWAKGRHIIAVNPAADLPKPGAEVRRDRVLTYDELKSIWHADQPTRMALWKCREASDLSPELGAKRSGNSAGRKLVTMQSD